jgi:hypothetical protein
MLNKLKELATTYILDLLLFSLFMFHVLQEESNWALIPLVGMIVIGEIRGLCQKRF